MEPCKRCQHLGNDKIHGKKKSQHYFRKRMKEETGHIALNSFGKEKISKTF